MSAFHSSDALLSVIVQMVREEEEGGREEGFPSIWAVIVRNFLLTRLISYY